VALAAAGLPLFALLAAGLAWLSFADDRRGLPIGVRFAAHAGASAAFLVFAIVDGGSWWWFVTLPLLVWMTNLYNFMDGSDGLAGGMAVFGFGAFAMAAHLSGLGSIAVASLGIAAASAAFLVFNFPPARVFMGDAGSIPLGFLVGALGLLGWAQGAWPFWFPGVVFSPFLADATVTLLRRLFRGERIWQAHRSHYYQRLVRLGWGHRRTALAEYAVMALAAVLGVVGVSLPPTSQAWVVAVVAGVLVLAGVLIDRAWRRHEARAAIGD
jgi:UDP-N-acetylmuramyl pentapeptide phosphotransferase/UDP-N-acetylglucosamine-1-phosphate transferase